MPWQLPKPATLLDRHPQIDWAAVAAARNVYRHEYEAVDEALLWHTVRHDLAALRSAAAQEFLRLQAEAPRDNRTTGGFEPTQE
jgi:uncharacterized protein with HEPN domain